MIGPVRALAALAAVALVAFAAWLSSATSPAAADIRSGQYSMEVAVGETGVATGGQFAAYVPIAGNDGAQNGAQFKHRPVWAFHGRMDANGPTNANFSIASS